MTSDSTDQPDSTASTAPSIGKKTVRDIDVRGKRVLVRADLNTPLEDGRVADDTRLRAAMPTLEYLIGQNARIVLCSHLGRPKGKRDARYSLRPVAERLGELMGREIAFVDDCVGEQVTAAAGALGDGQILLLENLRFHPEEEGNDAAFARQLADLADVYVNDAFGAAHRAHASTAAVAELLPAVAGFLMEREVRYLKALVDAPPQPFAAIVGGAKVSSKTAAVDNLLPKLDLLLVGGGMANTFLAAQGVDVKASLVEEEQVATARDILARAEQGGITVLLPRDVVVASELSADAAAQTVDVADVPDGQMILDIGPATVAAFAEALQNVGAVVWNGPMGVFEIEQFSHGSFDLARAVAALDAVTVVGGGETAALIERSGEQEKFTHISTGGGASLEMLEGRELPGVAALDDAG